MPNHLNDFATQGALLIVALAVIASVWIIFWRINRMQRSVHRTRQAAYDNADLLYAMVEDLTEALDEAAVPVVWTRRNEVVKRQLAVTEDMPKAKASPKV